MPAFPPPGVLKAHRQLHHDSRVGTRPGKITLGGVDYAAEIYLGPIEYEQLTEGQGMKLVQRMTARVLKTLLTTAPPRQTAIIADGNRFDSGKVEGQLRAEPAWIIHAHRLPKAS